MANHFAYLTSSSPGAPSISGTAGSLIAVLDYVLDVADTTNGWEKVYSGTNKAVYRPRFGNRFYFRVNDDGSIATQGAREAEVRGYESMSDVDTGTDPFPTVAQFSLPVWKKANTADSSNRSWRAIRTSRYLLLAIRWFDTVDSATAVLAHHYVMGDLPSLLPSDPWNSVLAFTGTNRTTSNGGAFSNAAETDLFSSSQATSTQGGAAAVRSPSGSAKSYTSRWGATCGSVRDPENYSTWSLGVFPRAAIFYNISKDQSVSSNVGGCPRLRVPNLHLTNFLPGASSGLVPGDTVQDGARNFVVTGSESNTTMQYMLMETTDTDGAL